MREEFQIEEGKWNEIIEAAFAPDAPIHNFSDSYKWRKNAMIGNGKKQVSRVSSVLRYVAAVILIIVLPVSAYAAYNWIVDLNQTGAYEHTFSLESGHVKKHDIKALNIGYIPEDMQKIDGKYINPDNSDRSVMTMFYVVSEKGMQQIVSYSTAAKTYQTETGNDVVLINRDRGSNQAWVAFKDTPYVVLVYYSQLSDDEISAVLNGLSLEQSSVEVATLWKDADTEVDFDEMRPFIPEKAELVSEGGSYETSAMNTITIDKVYVQSDFEGLKCDGINCDVDFSKYLREDGTIKTHRKFIIPGDGRNSLDTVDYEDEVTEKVLVLELTVTNNSSEDTWQGFNGSIFQQDANNGVINPYNRSSLDSYICIHEETGSLSSNGEHFSFECANKGNKNSTGLLHPGESATVKIAYLVDEDMTDNLYINLDPRYDNGTVYNGAPIICVSDYFKK